MVQNIDFDYIRNNGYLLFEYVRGSVAQGCAVEGKSDIDLGGVFMIPPSMILGFDYPTEIKNETNDIVWYELGKCLELLCNSNPTILEILFVDEKYIRYEHPIFKMLRDNRDMFVTKKCFQSFYNYGRSQILKAKGLNKMIVREVLEKRSPLDFCYTFKDQGSVKISDWLKDHGLKQRYCGLVKIDNMHDMYGVYYDWGAHLKEDESIKSHPWFTFSPEMGYSGIVDEDGTSQSVRYIQTDHVTKNDIMLNSVSKGSSPICFMSYNSSGYSAHARDYTRYQKWLQERNPVRYENNLGYNYDSKNCCHAFRLMNMCVEIAQGKGVIVDRTGIDRDFLLDIRNHKFSYEELMTMLEEKEKEMHTYTELSTLPEEVDTKKVEELLITIREKFYGKK